MREGGKRNKDRENIGTVKRRRRVPECSILFYSSMALGLSAVNLLPIQTWNRGNREFGR